MFSWNWKVISLVFSLLFILSSTLLWNSWKEEEDKEETIISLNAQIRGLQAEKEFSGKLVAESKKQASVTHSRAKEGYKRIEDDAKDENTSLTSLDRAFLDGLRKLYAD